MMPSPSQNPPSDEQLAIAARAGRIEAWEELVRRHYPPLLRYLTAQARDPDDAAEIAQDTFLAAANLLHRLPADRPFSGWLYRIAQNHLRRMWRRRTLRPLVSLDWLLGQSVVAIPALQQPGDVETTVAEAELVKRVLDGLSRSLREALLLNSLAGLSAHEVAVVLEISLPAAERRISRAKAQFRATYNALSEESQR